MDKLIQLKTIGLITEEQFEEKQKKNLSEKKRLTQKKYNEILRKK